MRPQIHQITLKETRDKGEHCVVALGFFDGVHIGHRALLDEARSASEDQNAIFSVFTFSDCGDGTYKAGAPRLTEWNERMDLFFRAGVERVYAADFSSLADMSPEDFVRDVLLGICHARVAVCGFNFRFGKNASAGAQELEALMRAYGGSTLVIPPLELDGMTVSSTAIRRALEDGDVSLANKMLGRPFSIDFPVIHGKMLGRTIGVPTINQAFLPSFIVPRHGVYACLCTIDGMVHRAVTNVGVRPTVENGSTVNCESHILCFDGWLYGRRIRVGFLHYLRPEIRFDGTDALVERVKQDIEDTKAIISDEEINAYARAFSATVARKGFL